MDTFFLSVTGIDLKGTGASQLLAQVLEGFLLNAPSGVSTLMALRNVLVKPLGLRTSPLGCPVSSLLSPKNDNLFANQYPVLDQDVNAEIALGTRVSCKNLFGRAYMTAIDSVHRRYIAPAILRRAVDYAIVQPGFQRRPAA